MSGCVACCCSTDAPPPAGFGSSTALGIVGITSVAFGLTSRSNLSQHFVVCCDETPIHAGQPGVSPCCWTRDFVMRLLLLLASGSSTASPLGFQGTCECGECVTLPLFVSREPPKRPNELDSYCCSHDDLVGSSVRPRNVPVAQRGSSFAISPRTIFKSTLTHLCQRTVAQVQRMESADAVGTVWSVQVCLAQRGALRFFVAQHSVCCAGVVRHTRCLFSSPLLSRQFILCTRLCVPDSTRGMHHGSRKSHVSI